MAQQAASPKEGFVPHALPPPQQFNSLDHGDPTSHAALPDG